MTADAETDDMYALFDAGTRVDFHDETYTVGEDGLWRNAFGMIPAGQVNPPPDPVLGKHCHECRCADRFLPPQHCRGCCCKPPGPPTGRMSHGGTL